MYVPAKVLSTFKAGEPGKVQTEDGEDVSLTPEQSKECTVAIGALGRAGEARDERRPEPHVVARAELGRALFTTFPNNARSGHDGALRVACALPVVSRAIRELRYHNP